MSTDSAYPSLLKKFTNLRRKRTKIRSNIQFLLACKKENVFPNFMKFRFGHNSKAAFIALQKIKRMWLIAELKTLHTKLFFIETQFYEIHLLISKTLAQVEWDYLDWSSNLYCSDLSNTLHTRHVKKLLSLTNAKTTADMTT